MVQETLTRFCGESPIPICCIDSKDGRPVILSKDEFPEKLKVTYKTNSGRIRECTYPTAMTKLDDKIYFSCGRYVINNLGDIVFKTEDIGEYIKDIHAKDDKILITTDRAIYIKNSEDFECISSLKTNPPYKVFLSGCIGNNKIVAIRREYRSDNLDGIIMIFDLRSQECHEEMYNIQLRGPNFNIRTLDKNMYILTNAYNKGYYQLAIVDLDDKEIEFIDGFKVKSAENLRFSNRMSGLDVWRISKNEAIIAVDDRNSVNLLYLDLNTYSVEKFHEISNKTGPIVILDKNKEFKRNFLEDIEIHSALIAYRSGNSLKLSILTYTTFSISYPYSNFTCSTNSS